MEFIREDIQKYAEDHSEPESDLLHKINRETHLHVLKPRMLSGHLQGRVLAMLSGMIRPFRILEIGTYTGYATLCLAEGLTAEGKVITVDLNEELSTRTKGYFAESAYAGQIEMKVGNALEIIPSLNEKWDMVFIDADKENYFKYYEMVINNVNPGGYIIADNVLWSGKVTDRSRTDTDTEAIRTFNLKINQDHRVKNVLFPMRDGLMIMRKV